jgi:predicted transglutaminase-like cysteine proteinase
MSPQDFLRGVPRALLLAILATTAVACAAGDASAKTRKLESLLETSVKAPIAPPRAAGPAHFFTINQVLAKQAGAIDPTRPVQLAAATPNDRATDGPVADVPLVRSSDEPFGLLEFRAPEGHVWTKWRQVEADIAHDGVVMAQCRAEPEHCTSRAAERFIAIIDNARRQAGKSRLEAVNRAVNNAIRYTSDMEQHGVIDVWSAPLATFATGRGDCKDYAFAKYVALKEAGIASDDLRLLLVRDQAVHLDHAVVAARQDGRWFILDNRHMLMPEDSDMWNFVPLFAIGQEGVKLLASPYANRLTGFNAKETKSLAADSSPAEADATGSSSARIGTLPLLM